MFVITLENIMKLIIIAVIAVAFASATKQYGFEEAVYQWSQYAFMLVPIVIIEAILYVCRLFRKHAAVNEVERSQLQ